MSRKDYQLLASYIARIEDEKARKLAAIAVANACKADNPRFAAQLFFAACNVQLGV